MLTILVSAVFAILLALEWRYRSRLLRLAAVSFALVVLYFAQPMPWRAARRALSQPVAERLTTWRGGGRALSEYESGVLTMHRVVVSDIGIGAEARLVGLGALVWLAASPGVRAIRRDRPAVADAALPDRQSAAPAV